MSRIKGRYRALPPQSHCPQWLEEDGVGYRDIVTRDEGGLVGRLWRESRLQSIDVDEECD